MPDVFGLAFGDGEETKKPGPWTLRVLQRRGQKYSLIAGGIPARNLDSGTEFQVLSLDDHSGCPVRREREQ